MANVLRISEDVFVFKEPQDANERGRTTKMGPGPRFFCILPEVPGTPACVPGTQSENTVDWRLEAVGRCPRLSDFQEEVDAETDTGSY